MNKNERLTAQLQEAQAEIVERYKFETRVEEYNQRKNFNRHAKKLAKAGWQVHNVEQIKENQGCMKTGCFGLIFLPLALIPLLNKNEKLLVTYRRYS